MRPELFAGTVEPATGRQRIGVAAVDLFFRQGFAAVGIRQIADAVGISTATLYHYFESKRQILEVLLEDTQTTLNQRSAAILATRRSARDRFIGLSAVLTAAQITSRKTCYLVDNEMRALDHESPVGKHIAQLRQAYEDYFHRVIADGHAEGVFDAVNLDVIRVNMLGMYSAVSLWYRPNPFVAPLDLCIILVDLGLRILGAGALSPAERAEVIATVDLSPFPWEPPELGGVVDAFPGYANLRGA